MADKIALLRNELDRFKDMPYVGEVRQRGFMVGIELVKNKKTKKPFAPAKRSGKKWWPRRERRGVIIRPLGDVIVLMPPPAIDAETLKELVDVTYDAIKEATGA